MFEEFIWIIAIFLFLILLGIAWWYIDYSDKQRSVNKFKKGSERCKSRNDAAMAEAEFLGNRARESNKPQSSENERSKGNTTPTNSSGFTDSRFSFDKTTYAKNDRCVLAAQSFVHLIDKPPFSDLCNDYNNSVSSGSFADFKRKHKSVSVLIGLQNALEYMNDRTLEPIFVQKNDGKFLGIAEDDQIYVFPKPSMTLVDVDHGSGAFSRVFDCGGFEMNKKYTKVSVLKPAIFVQSGQQFLLREKGKLELGYGEIR